MIAIPHQTGPREYDLFICVDDNSISRMREYDPAETDTRAFPASFHNLHLRRILVGFFNKEDLMHINRLGNEGKIDEVIQYLSRGYKFLPEKGDYEGPPLSILVDKNEPRQ